MSFGAELSDFSKAFAASSAMAMNNRQPPHYVSQSEVELRKAQTRAQEESIRASQTANTPEAAQADIDYKRASAGNLTEQTRASQLAHSAEAQTIANENLAAQTKLVLSQTGLNQANLDRLKDPEFRQAELDGIAADYGLKAAQAAALWAQAADMTDPAMRAAKIEGVQAEAAGRRAGAAVDTETARAAKWQNDMDAAVYGGGDSGLTVEGAQGALPVAPAQAPETQDTGTAPAPQGAIDVTASPKLASAMAPYPEQQPVKAAYRYQPVPAAGEAAAPAASSGGGGGGLSTIMSTAQRPATVTDPHTGQKISLPTMTPMQAAVWAGNAKQESGGNPNALNKGEGAFGTIQWRLDRRANLERFARANGMPVNDVRTQTLFGRWELVNTERGAGSRFLAADTPEEANAALKRYIRYGDNSQGTRLANARQLMGGAPGPEETTAMTTPGGPAVGGDEFDRTGTGTQIRIATGPQRSPAVIAGLQHINQMASLDPGAVPQADPQIESRQRDVLQGAGAASNQEVAEVKQVVSDQQGPAATPGQENYRALNALYEHYMRRGEPEKAKNAAASMLQWMRVAKDRYLAFSKAEAQSGDLDRSTRDLAMAYAHVPDGNDMRITKDPKSGHFIVDVTDQQGNPVHREMLSPEEYVTKVMKLNPETDVWGMLYRNAGVEDTRAFDAAVSPIQEGNQLDLAPGTGALEAMPQTPNQPPAYLPDEQVPWAGMSTERAAQARLIRGQQDKQQSDAEKDLIKLNDPDKQAAVMTAIQGAVSGQAMDMEPLAWPGDRDPNLNKVDTADLEQAAYEIYASNKKANVPLAAQTVRNMMAVNPVTPDKLPFTASKSRDGETITVSVRGQQPMKMSRETYDNMLRIRETFVDAAFTKLGQDATEAKLRVEAERTGEIARQGARTRREDITRQVTPPFPGPYSPGALPGVGR